MYKIGIIGDRESTLCFLPLGFSVFDAENADALIKEALGLFLSLRSQRISVITTEELKDNSVLLDAVRKYGARLYISQ